MNIRQVGAALLRVAVRRAAPELRPWGNAMLNEMDSIEGDWAAFRWAVGSTTALFRRVELPINDASELPKRLDHLQETTRRWQRSAYLVCSLVISGFAYYLVMFPNIIERLGSVLTILGAAFLALQVYWNCVKRRGAVSDNSSSAVIDQYRAVLQHRRDFHTGIWLWSRIIVFLPGPLLFMYGHQRVTLDPNFLFVIIAFLVLALMGIPLNLRLSRKFQREIERLDAVRKQHD